jgi:TolA-binding protein
MHHLLRSPIFVFLASMPVLAGCMTSQREEELKLNILKVDQKVQELEKQLAQKDKTFDVYKNSSEDAKQKVNATKNDIEELKRQMALTQGGVDELRVKLTRVQESAGGATSGTNLPDNATSPVAGTATGNAPDDLLIERRMARLELLVGPILEKHNKDKSTSKSDKSAKFKTASELSKALSQAYSKKEFAKVTSTASEVLATSPTADMKEIALEYRGTSLFQMQKFDKAALDFTELLEGFPKSEKRARSLLYAGDSFVYLKNSKAAKSYYMECVKKFPEKEECKAAQERLNKMAN